MYPQITPEDASAGSWDVIVAGTSFAAMFFVHALPPGLRVLMIEKGVYQDHSGQLLDGRTPEDFNLVNTSGVEKLWVAHSMYGGNSNCWTGQVPRFLPDDFRMHERFGVGLDWPISYDDLEEAYYAVEAIMLVNGGGSDHRIPRRRPFPYPAHVPSRSDVVLRTQGPDWFAAPTARRRGLCCGNGVCHLCPIDAKFTVLNGFDDLAYPDVSLLLQAEVRQVMVTNGEAKGVLARIGEREIEIAGSLVALGTNAIFNAAILLRSGLGAPALGRYLHEQNSRNVIIDAPVKNYFGGTSITGHGYHFYAAAPRSEVAAVMIENFNSPPKLRATRDRWTERLRLKLIADDLPSPDNRVVLDETGEPRILWSGHSQYSRDGLDRAIDRLPEILPFEIEDLRASDYGLGQAHIQGTHRMGLDPTDSVVDAGLRTHDVSNLLALGSGAFPSCSPANPTLTLAALSIHAARRL